MMKRSETPGAGTPGNIKFDEKMNMNTSVANVEIINAETDDNLTGIIIDGVPHLYWFRVYKAMGLTSDHAVQVIRRLEEGKHYVRFTKQELKEKYGTHYTASVVDSHASVAYYLTAEGYNRAIMEIRTSEMDNKEIAAAIDAKKDHIAAIYTRYQRGEIVSLAVDESKPILPEDNKAVEITNENLAIADVFIKYACPHLKLDPGMVISASLTNAEQRIKKLGGNVDFHHLKGMIPRLLPDEPAYLNATELGKIFNLSGMRMNIELERIGLHTKVSPDSRAYGVIKAGWTPTQDGIPHGEWKPVTKGHSNGSVHHEYRWYWKESVIPEIRNSLHGNYGAQQVIA